MNIFNVDGKTRVPPVEIGKHCDILSALLRASPPAVDLTSFSCRNRWYINKQRVFDCSWRYSFLRSTSSSSHFSCTTCVPLSCLPFKIRCPKHVPVLLGLVDYDFFRHKIQACFVCICIAMTSQVIQSTYVVHAAAMPTPHPPPVVQNRV